MSFAVPETYTVLDPAQLGDDFYEGPAFEELAARGGLTPEQFERFLREAIELYVFAPAASKGFVDNVTVAELPGSELPTRDQLEQTLVGLGAQDLVIEHQSADGTEYFQSEYSLKVGEQTVFGVDVQIAVDGATAEITATSAIRETADRLAALVIDTVAAA